MDFQQRRTYYNLCRPEEPLQPEDVRNVDFDALDAEIRGAGWAQSLKAQIELANEPECLLVAGLPGSGKSTELRRFARMLESDESAGLLSVFVDAEDLLDLNSTVDIPDIIAAILFEAEKKVLELEGQNPEGAMREGYLQRFWNWLTQTNVELGRGNLSIPGGASLSIELKTRPSLRQHVRTTVSSHLNQFLTTARQELRELDLRATARGYGGLLIIFDSLEKLRGTTSSWHDVLDSAEIFFRQSVPMLELPVHVVFTVPTALLTRIAGIELQPMLKLRARTGEAFEPGIAAARELIAKRLPDSVLEEVLGPDYEQRCRNMILWTGGYPRQLVQVLQLAVRGATRGPLSQEAFERLFANLVETYRLLVPTSVIPWLATVSKGRFMTVDNDEHRLAADRMLQNNVILYYQNGAGWYDLHPAVYENPEVQQALAQLG